MCEYRSGGRCTPIPDIKPKKGTIFQTTSAVFKTHHRLCLASGFCRNSKTTIRTMAFSRLRLLLPFLLCPILFISHPVICDEEDTLLSDINSYRQSLNLNTLTKNDNAECLAEEVADQFKSQPCTNSTGSNTVPGTEPQIPNYESLLAKCHLNISNTKDGSVMPACVPNLDPSLVLTNFTKTLYSGNLNDTKYTGAGIGSDGNWIVVVLTTNTSEGSFETYNAASLTTKIGHISHLLFLLMASLFLL